MLTAMQALERLKEGNARFAAHTSVAPFLADPARRAALVAGQEPFAIIIGCSDSRVPAELVFDQGLGDLFVIRIAGNIVAPSQIASVEFAAARFGTRLVVVMGHAQCGAVTATLDEVLGRASADSSRNLRSIVDRIRPSVESVLAGRPAPHAAEEGRLLDEAIRENVRTSIRQLQSGSPLLEGLVRDDGLLIVGAEYSLETGVVDFLDRGVEES